MTDSTITLRAEHSGQDWRYLRAYLDTEGALHIDGQDLGPSTAPVSSGGEYEWFTKVRATDLPQLIELLGGTVGTDVLALLAEQYSGDGSYELERIIRESGIPAERFVH